jgi:hypothetical protein
MNQLSKAVTSDMTGVLWIFESLFYFYCILSRHIIPVLVTAIPDEIKMTQSISEGYC